MFSFSCPYFRWEIKIVSFLVIFFKISDIVPLYRQYSIISGTTCGSPNMCALMLLSVWSGYVEGHCNVKMTPVPDLDSGEMYSECVTVHVLMKADGTEPNWSCNFHFGILHFLRCKFVIASCLLLFPQTSVSPRGLKFCHRKKRLLGLPWWKGKTTRRLLSLCVYHCEFTFHRLGRWRTMVSFLFPYSFFYFYFLSVTMEENNMKSESSASGYHRAMPVWLW